MSGRSIGWYVHHQGAGHAHRAAAVARALGPDVAVTGLSTAPAPPGWVGPWVRLPPDGTGADPTAGGVLHWAPLHDPGYAGRMAALAGWVAAAQPELVVVDASVEVTLLLRLLGVPVVVVAAPGDRLDRPHRAAMDAATHLLAPWPRWERPPGWPDDWWSRTTATGAFSGHDGRPCAAPRPRTVTVLWGAGGLGVDPVEVDAAVAATPGWTWTVLGAAAAGAAPHHVGWVPDPWALLSSAAVVVTHAGQNALAEVAAARRPAVVLPQERPHHEQATTGAVLARAGLATVLDRWPSADRWPGLLTTVATADGTRWERWSDGAGAARAADALRTVLATAGGPA